jgi:pimeloyl-ACP methyl ester carboxylesterase
VGLSTHVEDVRSLLFYDDLRSVTLVGHSYAGMVITGVAALAPERLSRLIYVDAYIPGPGQCWLDLASPAIADTVVADMATTGYRAPPSPGELGVHDPELAAWVAERLVATPAAVYAEPLPADGLAAGAVPGAFIHCMLGPWAEQTRRFADIARARNWPTREIAAGHDAMLSAPAELAALLDEIADDTRPAGLGCGEDAPVLAE